MAHPNNGKIKHPLPRPTHCDSCGSSNISLERNRVLYGRDYGDWPLCWFCFDCKALVGCHKGTDVPMGRMADGPTRKARQKAHAHFDPLWKKGRLSRQGTYNWLAEQLGIHIDECHISWFDYDTCMRVVEICKKRTP